MLEINPDNEDTFPSKYKIGYRENLIKKKKIK